MSLYKLHIKSKYGHVVISSFLQQDAKLSDASVVPTSSVCTLVDSKQ